MSVKAYKGFNKDMTCRWFQFKEGETYEEERAEVCKSGFHACENPIDCLSYYAPNASVYHEVELDGDVSRGDGKDSKIAASRIKIGAKIDFKGMIKASVDFVLERVKATTGNYAHSVTTGYSAHSATTGDYAHSATTGDYAHSVTTGNSAHSATTGNSAHSATTGDYAHSVTTGNSAHSATTGNSAHSATTGNSAHSVTTGDYAHSATTGNSAHSATTGNSAHSATTGNSAHSVTTGNYAHSATTGDYAHSATTGNSAHSEVKGANTIAAALGADSKARGALGCWIVVSEWETEGIPVLIGVRAGKIDGETLKPDTWYKLENGEFVEAEDDGE